MDSQSSLRAQLFAESPPGGNPWPAGMLLAVAFTTAYFAMGYVQFYHWNIANGLLFAVLWVLPRRWWALICAATILARIASGVTIYTLTGINGPFLGFWSGPIQFALGNMLEPFLALSGVSLLRAWHTTPSATATGPAIARLHAAAMLSALALVGKDLLYVLDDGIIADVRRAVIHDPVPIGAPGSWPLLATFAIKNALGNFIGIMLVAPLAWWIATPRHRAGSSAILRAGAYWLLPVVTAYLALTLAAPGSQLAELLRLLLLAAVTAFAALHGWRGAALAVLAASLAIAIEDHAGTSALNPVWMQLFIAIAGAMALMFGATVDDLRHQGQVLAAANATTARLASELCVAAARNLQAEERERRRLAGELHDEFGQTLTAMQTHLKIAQPEFMALARPDIADTLLELTRTMRQNIAGVLESLRPAALDELGLYGAIDRGSLRHLAEDAGLAFHVQLDGDARLLALLDDTHRIAAYRAIQTSVTKVTTLPLCPRSGRLLVADQDRGPSSKRPANAGRSGSQDRWPTSASSCHRSGTTSRCGRCPPIAWRTRRGSGFPIPDGRWPPRLRDRPPCGRGCRRRPRRSLPPCP